MFTVRLQIQFISLLSLLFYAVVSPVAADSLAESTLRAGFYAKSFPDFSVEDVEVSIKLLSEELGDEVGINTQVTVYEDIDAMRQDFELGKINFVVASSILLATRFDSKTFADGFRITRSGGASDKVLVLVRKQPGKANLKDFHGKRLVLAQYDPVTDLYMDFIAWSTFNQGYKVSFKEIAREKKANQLMLRLFFNQADVTCVYDNAYQVAVELNPQLREQLQIVAEIDGIPQGGGLFHVNTPEAFRESVIAKAVKLDSNPRGQQLLQLFKGDKTVRSTTDDLLQAKELYASYQRLQAKK